MSFFTTSYKSTPKLSIIPFVHEDARCELPDLLERQTLLSRWLSDCFPEKNIAMVLLAGDASFRRYFRATIDAQSFVVMDAPPAHEDCTPFIAIANAFSASSVRLPHIHAMNLEQGFLLLSDFGDQQFLSLLNSQTADALYRSAIDTLVTLQNTVPFPSLPAFDAQLYWREFDIFLTWYVKKNLGKNLSDSQESQLRAHYQWLIDSAEQQPQVFVHRDYHSRNLMMCADNQLGILDFQDAVRGPVTYDLVSLLRDCYVAWPNEKVTNWVNYFYEKLRHEKTPLSADFDTFLRWFDWMGLQRHLKCLGIFSRLYFRDNKNGYLKDIPRVLHYALSVCDRYSELSALGAWLR
ncbi:MAG TPA: phosphotransferase [Coxiellaceae bacterium]|nr:phosphotransferase [Coxiellaceae bacterium]